VKKNPGVNFINNFKKKVKIKKIPEAAGYAAYMGYRTKWWLQQ
jgi:hypothetical protein